MKCKTAISSYSLKNQLKLYFMELHKVLQIDSDIWFA